MWNNCTVFKTKPVSVRSSWIWTNWKQTIYIPVAVGDTKSRLLAGSVRLIRSQVTGNKLMMMMITQSTTEHWTTAYANLYKLYTPAAKAGRQLFCFFRTNKPGDADRRRVQSALLLIVRRSVPCETVAEPPPDTCSVNLKQLICIAAYVSASCCQLQSLSLAALAKYNVLLSAVITLTEAALFKQTEWLQQVIQWLLQHSNCNLYGEDHISLYKNKTTKPFEWEILKAAAYAQEPTKKTKIKQCPSDILNKMQKKKNNILQMCLKTEHLFLYVYRLCNYRIWGSEFSAHLWRSSVSNWEQ